MYSQPSEMEEKFPYLTQDMADCEPDPELIRMDRELPVQYIKNIRDGSVIGYKYFEFEGADRISVKVRGKAQGSFTVAADAPENVVGSIPIKIDSGEWMTVSGETEVIGGVHALYFEFKGDGCLDFVTFTLQSSIK